VNELGLEAVNHADCAGPIRVQQIRTLSDNRKIFVYQQTLVDNIDLKFAGAERVVIEFKLLWRTDNGWIPFFLKELLE